MGTSHGPDRTSILVVDDQPINRALLAAVLEAEGYQVHLADGAEQAMASLEHVRPRIVLTDLQMPGVDGLALAGMLRAHPATGDALIVAITAYPRQHGEVTALAAGFDDYIEKPIDVGLLPTLLAARLSPLDGEIRDAGAHPLRPGLPGAGRGAAGDRQPLRDDCIRRATVRERPGRVGARIQRRGVHGRSRHLAPPDPSRGSGTGHRRARRPGRV